MEEEGLRSALAVGGEGSLVGKELLSPEGNPRQSVSLLHAPYVQEVRLDIVQGFAYSPDGQEMGRQDIPAHAAQGKNVDGLVAHPDGFRGRNGFAEGDPVDVKIFLRFQSMKKGKIQGIVRRSLLRKDVSSRPRGRSAAMANTGRRRLIGMDWKEEARLAGG